MADLSAPTEGEYETPKLQFQYKTTRRVNVPVIKMARFGEYFFRLEAPFEFRAKTNAEDGESKNIPILKVTDLETGIHGEIVPGKVLIETLTEGYPKDGYVGKSFKVTKQKGKEASGGKQGYNLFYLEEIEVETPEAAAPANKKAGK